MHKVKRTFLSSVNTIFSLTVVMLCIKPRIFDKQLGHVPDRTLLQIVSLSAFYRYVFSTVGAFIILFCGF